MIIRVCRSNLESFLLGPTGHNRIQPLLRRLVFLEIRSRNFGASSQPYDPITSSGGLYLPPAL